MVSCGAFRKNSMKKIFVSKTKSSLSLFLCLFIVSGCGKNQEQSRQDLVEKGFAFDEVSFYNVARDCENTGIIDDYINAGMKPDRGLLGAAESGCLKIFEKLVNKTHNKEVLAEALYKAIDGIPSEDRNQIIEQLLNKGVDTNTKLNGRSSYLRAAVKNNNPVAVKRLLDRDALSDRKRNGITLATKRGYDSLGANSDSYSLLFEAVKKQNFEIVKILLENGIDPNDGKNNSSDSLIQAVNNNSVKIVEILLAKGANPNSIVNDLDRCILSIAADSSEDKIVKLLVENGATVNNGSGGESLILQNAVKKESIKVAIALVESGANPNTKIAENGDSILSYAAAKGKLELVRSLLKKGAKVNDARNGGSLSLLKSVENKQSEIVRELLKSGANPNTKNGHNRSSRSVLTIATRNVDRSTVKILLENGANPNDNTDGSSYALYVAADKNDVEIVRLLLENGAKDINKNQDDPALRKAFALANTEIVKLLIETGANPNTVEYGGFGINLTELAKQYSQSEVNRSKYSEIAKILEAATYVRQGVLYKKDGDLAKARIDFDRAISIDPESASAYLFRSQLKLQLGDEIGAKRDLDRSEHLYQKLGLIKYFESIDK